MTWSQRVLVVAGALLLVGGFAGGASSFAPFEEWKAAVMAGDRAALARLYSTHPAAVAQVGRAQAGNIEEEWRFWRG